jgi:glycosyltransferase involved in cell wall biosynthesis
VAGGPSSIDALAPPARRALDERIGTLFEALGRPAPAGGVLDALLALLARAQPPELWLAAAVISGRLPDRSAVDHLRRAVALEGPVEAVAGLIEEAGLAQLESWPQVEVVTGQVVVDVHHTAVSELSTGIQRVVRETVRRWRAGHDLLVVGWTRRYLGMRRLSADELAWVLEGPRPLTAGERRRREVEAAEDAANAPIPPEDVLVPWRCVHVVPELAAEPSRALRYKALALYSARSTGTIGFDCVPIMAAETSAEGMAIGFSWYLAALAHFDRVAAISGAAATEYAGWRAMLAGSGRRGPEVRAVALPVEAGVPSPEALARARDLLGVGELPVVLVVGSHEPRKNHLAVLEAADALWRQGLDFALTFVGGNAWKSEAFEARVQELQVQGRPVQAIRGLPDELLWAAYRVAYCTVFVSVHEGFGLPLAESLASGTPAITSDFGSMREIAAKGGALMVDPRDDGAVTGALRRLLESPALRARLAGEARRLRWRSWDDYAADAWAYLAGVSGSETAVTG